MQIARGSRLVRRDDGGNRQVVQIKAVRYSPVPYAEVEPTGGGQRSAVLLTELERDFQPEPAVPVELSPR
ncbi:hypothetical protein [Nocardia iowensis]|uniref:Uncharacterized protein n=1 Tax=Nocardia iowensis TaxID=204891 RepID=A0ABX8S091_NOCIO|nr:hypothetical protein [Nocardia iowensis]QXN94040.1 hypothetical protein KV110_13840 [Nocardia iowensis]